ncbi:MAG: hypothetical protein M1820_001550 [Bogoriella megaspora]|nr:MAG: hypothetical protein M1820_001550 [Bogoriella megaspora]
MLTEVEGIASVPETDGRDKDKLGELKVTEGKRDGSEVLGIRDGRLREVDGKDAKLEICGTLIDGLDIVSDTEGVDIATLGTDSPIDVVGSEMLRDGDGRDIIGERMFDVSSPEMEGNTALNELTLGTVGIAAEMLGTLSNGVSELSERIGALRVNNDDSKLPSVGSVIAGEDKGKLREGRETSREPNESVVEGSPINEESAALTLGSDGANVVKGSERVFEGIGIVTELSAMESGGTETDGDGINSDGIDSDGIDSDGIDSDGIDSDGVDSDGIDSDGIDSDGTDTDGIDSDGVDSDGIDRVRLGTEVFKPLIDTDGKDVRGDTCGIERLGVADKMLSVFSKVVLIFVGSVTSVEGKLMLRLGSVTLGAFVGKVVEGKEDNNPDNDRDVGIKGVWAAALDIGEDP